MKNTFGVTMALLLVLTIGGSYLGFKKATTPHHATTEHKDDGHGAKKSHDAGSDHKEEEAGHAEDQAKTEESKTETPEKEIADSAEQEKSTESADQTAEVAKATEEDQTKTEEPKAEASEQAKKEKEPAEQTKVAAKGDKKAGQEKYMASCGGCHGANAAGGLGPALADAGQWTIEEFTVALREGRTPTKTLGATMPKYTEAMATDEDLTNIHAYLATLK